MRGVRYETVCGSEHLSLELSSAHNDNRDYHIYINQYYHGSLYKQGERWLSHLNERSWLTIDDIQAMGELIETGCAGSK